MCGRFTIAVSQQDLLAYLDGTFNIQSIAGDMTLPRYNVAPGQEILAVIGDGKDYRAGLLKWGFVPTFATDEKVGYKMINARSETLDHKPSYKTSFSQKRCVIVADGFYEWKKGETGKVPMRIRMHDRRLFQMAGIWNTYKRPDGSKLHTCAIITTQANDLVSTIHNRMPVIINDNALDIWLDPKRQDLKELKKLLIPYAADEMEAYEVSSYVNKAVHEGPECITPVK